MKVTLICGPPASGKTTWVRARAARGDLIVDLDSIASALSGLQAHDKPDAVVPFALAAREAVYALIERSGTASPIRAAWVIAGLPVRSEREELARRLRAQVVVLETSAGECVRRLHKARRPAAPWIHEVINRWWQRYEPSPGDERIGSGAEWWETSESDAGRQPVTQEL